MNQTNRGGCYQTMLEFMHANPPPDTLWKQGGLLPTDFLLSLYQTLIESDRISFLNFNSLDFSDSIDIRTESGSQDLYKTEYANWRASARDTGKDLTFFIQHDSDSAPLETQYLCNLESQIGVKSTTSIFARYIVGDDGAIRYPMDYSLLKRLQDERGMCFTYHCNAAELAMYDESRIGKVFDEDISFLQAQGLNIRFYSPHGGRVSDGGKNNNSFYYPAQSRFRVICTHNPFSPVGLRYSDGSFLGRLKKADPTLELRNNLIKKLSAPKAERARYFILIHPQYYFATNNSRAARFFRQNAWLEEFWALHAQGRALDYWAPLRAALASLD